MSPFNRPKDSCPERSPERSEDEFRYLAIHRVSVREYAAAEMKTYLIRKGAAPALAEAIINELVEEGKIDDRRYARVIARHQAFRDKGPSYVLAKLRQKGVSLSMRDVQALYEEALPEQSASELELARSVLERRYPDAFRDAASKKRAWAGLLRRGFSVDVVQKCLSGPASSVDPSST